MRLLQQLGHGIALHAAQAGGLGAAAALGQLRQSWQTAR
jgi:hypothetical protein